jgi:hypothetical protein
LLFYQLNGGCFFDSKPGKQHARAKLEKPSI